MVVRVATEPKNPEMEAMIEIMMILNILSTEVPQYHADHKTKWLAESLSKFTLWGYHIFICLPAQDVLT